MMNATEVTETPTPAETFPGYLRRVGADHAESGMEYTAKDYTDAAKRIETLEAKLANAERRVVYLETAMEDLAQLVVQGLDAEKAVENQTGDPVSDVLARRIQSAAFCLTQCAERASMRRVSIWEHLDWRELCEATVAVLHDGHEVGGPLTLIKLLKNREPEMAAALRRCITGKVSP